MQMTNGCAEFVFPNAADLKLDQVPADVQTQLAITATVTEYGTNKMDLVTGSSKVAFKGYHLKLVSDEMFRRGLPYEGTFKLTNINVEDVTKEVVEICYNLAIRKGWDYFNDEQCRNYSPNGDGFIYFKLWPFKSSVLHVHLHVRQFSGME